MKPTGNTILVTGGGSGIGRELARSFHRAGNTVIIAGRRRELLQDVAAAHPGMIAKPLDMEDAEAVTAFATQVVVDHPGLNVLVCWVRSA
jgi:uncharacterized oxidoreductase